MIDDSKSAAAACQLLTMMTSIGNDHETWFGMGKMRCRKKLANGYVVTVSITEPRPKRAAQVSRKAGEP